MKLFVTGTGTGVGKTTVGRALIHLAKGQGLTVRAIKPIETGGRDDQEALGAENVYSFALPAAPLVAARAEGRTIDFDRLVENVSRETSADLTLVEGAGGWRVPITVQADMGTLAQRLGYPVLVVAAAGLGTINHTLLTLEAIERDGLQVHAVVLSKRQEDDASLVETNVEMISRVFHVKHSAPLVVFDGTPESLRPLLA